MVKQSLAETVREEKRRDAVWAAMGISADRVEKTNKQTVTEVRGCLFVIARSIIRNVSRSISNLHKNTIYIISSR